MPKIDDYDISESVKWLGDLIPDKTCDRYQTLNTMLRNNHYSTVVDLEEETFEINRYAKVLRITNYPPEYQFKYYYVEIDERCQISEEEIDQLFGPLFYDKGKTSRCYMRKVVV